MKKDLSKMLKKFKESLLAQCPDEIEAVTLFGSQARGDARDGSDIDILVVTKTDDWHLSDAIGAIAYDFLLETGEYISTKVMSHRHYEYLQKIKAPFMSNLSRDGIVL